MKRPPPPPPPLPPLARAPPPPPHTPHDHQALHAESDVLGDSVCLASLDDL